MYVIRFRFFNCPYNEWIVRHRPDDKTAKDFSIAAGSVLHLVLALRGGL